MLSRKDLLTVAKAICDTLRVEESKPALQGPDNQQRYAARGMAALSIEAIYYQAPGKTQAMFDYNLSNLFKAAGWPE